MKRKLIWAAVAAALSLVFASCSKEEGNSMANYTFCFSKDEASIITGNTYISSLKYSTDGVKYTKYSLTDNILEISFTSSNTAVATVSDGGAVKGIGNGDALIIAESAITHQADTLSVNVSNMTADEATFKNASWNWTKFGTGAMYGCATMALFSSVQNISIVKYPEALYTSSIVYNAGSACSITGDAATAANASIAINGSFFNTTTLVSATTFWNYGKLESTASSSEATNRSTGIVAFKNGKVAFDAYSASKLSTWESSYDAFISAGPLLVLNGTTQNFITRDFNDARHPRSMIGVTADRIVMMVVVDGRFSGKADGMTIPEMAKIAQYLGLQDAINLDGGGSSTLWTSGSGVLNYPCDNNTWDHSGCRRVPTVIVASELK